MREILFRGKRIDGGEWIEGYVFPQVIDGGYAPLCITTEPICANDYSEILGDWAIVDSSTVGQYTSLTDKNGRKIFEGDIVRLFDISVGEIVQECGAFGIGFRKPIDYDYLASEIVSITVCNNTPEFCYNDYYVSLYELYWNYNEENDNISVIEVIGNIHDNPELLEVGK